MRRAIWALAATLTGSGAARATECGEARLAATHLRAAIGFEQMAGHKKEAAEAQGKLKTVEKKLKDACAPRKVTIAALPLAYVSLPPGNLSKAGFQPGESWHLSVTTMAGSSAGIVFDDPAELQLPSGLKWETEPQAKNVDGEIWLAVAEGATLTVEEPQPGKGVWRIEIKARPLLYPMSKLAACVAGKPDPSVKLPGAACSMLLSVDPVATLTALPDRGRAVPLGEWQYGWHSTLDIGGDQIAAPAPDTAAPARLELALELSAPLPGISDGKKLAVTLESNAQDKPSGASFRLGHSCGDDDEKCEKARFAVEVWYDRVFGVPFLRVPPSGAAQARLVGKVTDRLAKPVAGQRVLMTSGARRIVTATDELGDYRFDGLSAGDAAVVPCGKNPANVPTGDETRAVKLGLGETKVPVIYINKLFE